MNYGCTILSLCIPDRRGRFRDIVLGFDQLEGYLQSPHYIGCIIGRYANRIWQGQFVLNDNNYSLPINQPPHHLHGGINGFDKKIWPATPFTNESQTGIVFELTSPYGDEGYPGTLKIEVRYVLENENTLSISYEAVSDQDTIINLTQHSYFNLCGGDSDILDHQLTIHSDYYLPVDEVMIPTGQQLEVRNTPFDFRIAKPVGSDIQHDDAQIQLAHGYDHTWILHKDSSIKPAAVLYDPKSGCKMEILTTQPGLQLYTANFLNGLHLAKNHITLKPQMGLCLETQHFPDSPNHPEFPSTTLKAGEVYTAKTVWRFSTD